VVWYTDRVVEAQELTGAPLGDLTLQHLLSKVAAARLTSLVVHGEVRRAPREDP
jgi:hypothetical protein